MDLIAIWSGKIIYLFLRLIGRSGGTLPGYVAEKLSPNLLTRKLSSLSGGVIVISGTNGKTTSTKMLTALLASQYKILTNPTGSNFTRGVVASVVINASFFGKLNFDYAVIELDEAYAAKFVEKVQPDYSLILNVSRDQMDRFGEIDYTAKLLQKVVASTTKQVFLNADDRRVISLQSAANCPVKTFGVSKELASIFVSDDELHSKEFSTRQHGVDAELVNLEDGITTIKIDHQTLKLKLNFFGVYNSQNATAVTLVAQSLGLKVKNIENILGSIQPAFGRGEIINYGKQKIILQLVKNPSGFRQALMGGEQMIADQIVIAINDNYADGRDVSWLWDVEFEGKLNSKLVVTSGSRAYDMALRLAYDEIEIGMVKPNLNELVDSLKPNQKGITLIYTTYTAMLKLRSILATKTTVERI